MTRSRYSVAVLTLLFLTACSTSDSDTYNAGDVGAVIDTSEATILSSRVVNIDGGDNSKVGAVAGGAVGGTAGYVVAGNNSARGLGVVLGTVIGAAAGYLAEDAAREREGIEYIVRMNDGRVVTLVQNRAEAEEPIANGTPVLVQYGQDYTRVIARPDGAASAAGGGSGAGGGSDGGDSGWSNPDAPTEASGETGSGSLQDVSSGGDTN